ncbi:MAG: CBS domain-containing protein [Phycisphaerales bacterium]|nr:CBS domain-containing protein [Phycisphaerales bacterium]
MLAADLLTEPPISIAPEVSIDDAVETMRCCRIRHLMVVKDDQLVGMVSDRDILLAKTEGGTKNGEADPGQLTVSQIMTKSVSCISPETDMQQIAEIMLAKGISALPVMANEDLYGVVTKTDLLVWYMDLCIRVPGHEYAAMKVRDCMPDELITVQSDDMVGSAVEIMARASVQHLPVIENGRLRGMISDRDLRRRLGVTVRGGLLKAKAVPSEQEYMMVGTMMTSNPRTINSEASVAAAVEAILAGGFSSLPVIRDDGGLVGIITVTDIIRLIGELASVPVA